MIDSHQTGKAAKKARLLADLSQIEMAGRMGITAGYYCDLEHGRRDWSTQLLQRFEIALKAEEEKK